MPDAATNAMPPIELAAYGMEVSTVSAAEFFGHQPSAPLTELSAFLNWNVGDDCSDLDALSCRLAGYLDVALYTSPGEGYAGCHFLIELFPALGLVPPGVIAVPRQLTLTAHNATVPVRLDMTLRLPRFPGSVLLVAKEDESAVGMPDPEALLVAAAIAAFQETQANRETAGLPALHNIEYPALVMDGTRPTFYKIPISSTLSAAVAAGPPENMQHPTRIVKCIVPARGHDQDMADREYRRRAVQYMDAFRELAFDLWRNFHGITNIPPRHLDL